MQLLHPLPSLCFPGQPRITTQITPQPYWRSGWLSCRNITIMLSGDQWTSQRKSENVNVLSFVYCWDLSLETPPTWSYSTRGSKQITFNSCFLQGKWQEQSLLLIRRQIYDPLKCHPGIDKINQTMFRLYMYWFFLLALFVHMFSESINTPL